MANPLSSSGVNIKRPALNFKPALNNAIQTPFEE
jgi:hypothetical protein